MNEAPKSLCPRTLSFLGLEGSTRVPAVGILPESPRAAVSLFLRHPAAAGTRRRLRSLAFALHFRPPRLASGRPLLPSTSLWCAGCSISAAGSGLLAATGSRRSAVRRGSGRWPGGRVAGWRGGEGRSKTEVWTVRRASSGWSPTRVLRPHSPGFLGARPRALHFLMWKMLAATSSGPTL